MNISEGAVGESLEKRMSLELHSALHKIMSNVQFLTARSRPAWVFFCSFPVVECMCSFRRHENLFRSFGRSM